MRSTLYILCLTATLLSAQTPAEHWFGIPDSLAPMSQDARSSIRRSYDHNPPYRFTMGAYNAVESVGGQFTVRLGENSAGNYAQRSKIVAAHYYSLPQDSITIWQDSRVFQLLVTNRKFDDRWAVYHIGLLHDRYGGDWMKIWQAWNGQKPGQAQEVRAWVRFFRYRLGWK